MNKEILGILQSITEEEQAILKGGTEIDRDIYMQSHENVINAKKLLSAGKLITIRPHVRFIHFPPHTHDYVEVVYVCAGQTRHVVNGNHICLNQGELLFMNQHATHEVLETPMDDLAVNIIVLPEFLNTVLPFIGENETPLKKFLLDCICREDSNTGYLHFKVADVVMIQNLVENLLLIFLQETPNKWRTSQMTMALLLMQLMSHTDALTSSNEEQTLVFEILSYIEEHYVTGSLTKLAGLLHYDVHSLSRKIKQKTGKNYLDLVREKRLAQAAFLLKNTERNVDSIANAVGYENIGYFHRIFRQAYGVSPRHYRLQNR